MIQLLDLTSECLLHITFSKTHDCVVVKRWREETAERRLAAEGLLNTKHRTHQQFKSLSQRI